MRCCRALRQVLDGRTVRLRDWQQANDSIIGVLQVQKERMFIDPGMIILVAAFNVISSLIMMVKDKTRDIAVLRTIGRRTAARCMRIFLMCGAFVGVTGTLIGTVIGVVFCRNIVDDPACGGGVTGGRVFNPSVFMLTASARHARLGRRGAASSCSALVLSLLATLYPSWRAARTDPVEALRHE